jgi:hypothetical protein
MAATLAVGTLRLHQAAVADFRLYTIENHFLALPLGIAFQHLPLWTDIDIAFGLILKLLGGIEPVASAKIRHRQIGEDPLAFKPDDVWNRPKLGIPDRDFWFRFQRAHTQRARSNIGALSITEAGVPNTAMSCNLKNTTGSIAGRPIVAA